MKITGQQVGIALLLAGTVLLLGVIFVVSGVVAGLVVLGLVMLFAGVLLLAVYAERANRYD